MSDVTQLTDAELMARLGRAAPPAPQPRRPSPNVSIDDIFPALIQQESGGVPGRLGPMTRYGQAQGMTQMLPATAREMAGKIGVPWRPELMTGTSPEAADYQSRLGRAYLEQGLAETGNMRDALHYYHGGPDRALWGPKTRAYADAVFSRVGRGGGTSQATQQRAAPSPSDLSDEQLLAQLKGDQPGEAPPWERYQADQTGPSLEERLSQRSQPPSALRGLFEPWLRREPVKYTPPHPGYYNPDTGEWDVVVDAAGVIDAGPDTKAMGFDYEIYDSASGYSYPATAEDVERYRGIHEREMKERERRASPEYQADLADAEGRAGNVSRHLLAALNGISLGLGDDLVAGGVSALTGLDATAVEESLSGRLDSLRRDKPGQALGTELVAGLFTPGVKGSGNWISQATGAQRLGRAAAVGAGYGALAGAGNASGSLTDRLDDAAGGGLLGAAIGGAGQVGIDRLAARMSRPPSRASAARRLSRRGVNLTPGQMLADVKGVGSTMRYVEDVAGGYNPLMPGVRQAQNEDVIRAAGAEALGHIGGSLPDKARTGYEVAQETLNRLGQAYEDVLPGINAQADDEVLSDLADLVNRAGQTLDDARLGRLDRILNQNVIPRFSEGGSLTGEDFKRIERTLREQAERAGRRGASLEDQDLADFLNESRDIVRNLVARQYPEAAARIQQINRGYAVAARIRRAVTGSAAFARDGTPTPAEMTQTVAQMSSEGQIIGGRGLLQQLAMDARSVLPATVGDTGSGQRAILGLLATGGLATISPELALGVASGAVIYSKLGIGLLNRVYRATDSQAAQDALYELGRLAQRDPALQPYYQEAARILSGGPQGAEREAPSPQPGLLQAPASQSQTSGLLRGP